MLHTRLYRSGVLEAENFDPELISDYLDDADTVVWLDLCAPTTTDLDVLGAEFGLHPLAIEDAAASHQRPKLDVYPDHVFLATYGVRLLPGSDELASSEVAVFATARWLITVRKDPGLEIDPVLRRWDGAADLAKFGVGFLLHGLLDVVVDGYHEVVAQLGERMEGIEDELFADTAPGPDVQRQIFTLRKSLVMLRRVVLPMRGVVASVASAEVGLVDSALAPYYSDVRDHVLRAAEATDSLRDLTGNAIETFLTIQGNRLNEIMKRLTSWAAILAVTTAIAGIYGMNVDFWPEPGTRAAFVFAMGLIVAMSVALFVYFRRKTWL